MNRSVVLLWEVRLLKSRKTRWCETEDEALSVSNLEKEGTIVSGPVKIDRTRAGLVRWLNKRQE